MSLLLLILQELAAAVILGAGGLDAATQERNRIIAEMVSDEAYFVYGQYRIVKGNLTDEIGNKAWGIKDMESGNFVLDPTKEGMAGGRFAVFRGIDPEKFSPGRIRFVPPHQGDNSGRPFVYIAYRRVSSQKTAALKFTWRKGSAIGNFYAINRIGMLDFLRPVEDSAGHFAWDKVYIKENGKLGVIKFEIGENVSDYEVLVPIEYDSFTLDSERNCYKAKKNEEIILFDKNFNKL